MFRNEASQVVKDMNEVPLLLFVGFVVFKSNQIKTDGRRMTTRW
jgi:hypothetical protein